jgi:hypothetical protein
VLLEITSSESFASASVEVMEVGQLGGIGGSLGFEMNEFRIGGGERGSGRLSRVGLSERLLTMGEAVELGMF